MLMHQLLMMILGYILADFLTGAFHWFEDNYGTETVPFLGKHVFLPNALHHSDPVAFTRGSYFYRNWTALVAALIFASLLWVCGMMNELMAWTCIFGSQANEIHCWSHMKCNWFIRQLQAVGLIMSPKNHSIHHKDPFDKNYCVMTNWLNPLLQHIDFWGRAERLLFAYGVNKNKNG